VNIPPPILEKIYNQGGDDDGDDHKHEDEQDLLLGPRVYRPEGGEWEIQIFFRKL
jgi:hypothetical protein